MKKVYLKKNNIFILLILAFSFLNSESFIHFEKSIYDFGDIQEEEGSVEYDFIFSNTGNIPLKLIDVETS